MHYVQVILPVKLWLPWYSTEEKVELGQRVLVQLAGKEYIGVVCKVADKPDIDPSRIVPLKSTDTGLEPVTQEEIRLWRFIADYYLCTMGEVYKAAYPLAKIKSEQTQARKDRKNPPAEKKLDLHFKGLSGKPILLQKADRTRDYILAAQQAMDSGLSTLILVPETEFGDNLQDALSLAFGKRLQVYNSLKTAVQKRKVMQAVRDLSEPVVILATRSALFLPFKDLGLVIVDEEQDSSYKQQEPTPRYQARDVAVVLAQIHGARLILGSAFPSLESVQNCREGKYDLVKGGSPLARIEVIDISAERRKKGMTGDFSYRLCDEIHAADGLVTIVRGYEREESVLEQVQKLFPELDPQIIRSSSARKSICHSKVTAVLQADALFDIEDFRADEKVLQILTLLSERTDRLVIQTAKASHPVYQALITGADPTDALLAERKQFNLPPFSRLVDVKLRNGKLVQRLNLAKDRTLASRKAQIASSHPYHIIDVDPQ